MTAATNEDCKGGFDEEKNKTFDSERFKPIKRDFSDRANEQISDCWVGSFPIPRVIHKGLGEEGHRPVRCSNFVIFLIRREMSDI